MENTSDKQVREAGAFVLREGCGVFQGQKGTWLVSWVNRGLQGLLVCETIASDQPPSRESNHQGTTSELSSKNLPSTRHFKRPYCSFFSCRDCLSSCLAPAGQPRRRVIQRSWWPAGVRGQRGWPRPRRVRSGGGGWGWEVLALEPADRHWNFGFPSGVSWNKRLNPSQPRPPRQRGGDDSSVYLPLIQHLSRCASTSRSPASALTHTHVYVYRHAHMHAYRHAHTHTVSPEDARRTASEGSVVCALGQTPSPEWAGRPLAVHLFLQELVKRRRGRIEAAPENSRALQRRSVSPSPARSSRFESTPCCSPQGLVSPACCPLRAACELRMVFPF